MFRKVLVANRGEIACRVIRTLRDLGIASVAVHPFVDRDAPHVAMADEAVPLEGDSPTAAYLDRAQILAACAATGAEALHPGYGFLSENADFAEAVAAAGVAFVGPDARAMRLMGDKIRSREFAAAHGVPVSKSVVGDAGDRGFLGEVAALGYPILLKASAGGGGKGMKIVRAAEDLAPQAAAASGEAARYFGDGRIYAERLVERPRHIEVQVLGDGEGTVVHLGERECSIQRRYQKIVEESPAAALAPDVRDAICAAAVRLTSAARYRNAGTVEFLLAPDGTFFFLEMNTRLQVEHPVTEMVTGLDLVAEQLHVAATGRLRIRQDDLRPRGHAIECRICAEEPEHDFRPAVGKIGLLRLPTGDGVRFDGGIREGQAVTPAFDSMLAKLVAHGATRTEAIGRMARALDGLVLLGVRTNVDYLARVIRSAAFARGELHTGFVTEHADALAPATPPPVLAAAALAAGALGTEDFRRGVEDVPAFYAAMGRWRN